MTDAIATFDASSWGARGVHVAGVGTIGSWFVVQAARMGARNIHVYDGDRVEAHNPLNQAYGQHDQGLLKVEALAQIIERDTGTKITCHPYMLDEKTLPEADFEGVLLASVDGMEARLPIFEETLRSSVGERLKLMIEVRIDLEHGFVYAFNPGNFDHRDAWLKTWHPSTEVVRVDGESCSTRRATIPMGMAFAAVSAAQWIKWFQTEQRRREEEDFYHELMLDLYGNVLRRRQF